MSIRSTIDESNLACLGDGEIWELYGPATYTRALLNVSPTPHVIAGVEEDGDEPARPEINLQLVITIITMDERMDVCLTKSAAMKFSAEMLAAIAAL